MLMRGYALDSLIVGNMAFSTSCKPNALLHCLSSELFFTAVFSLAPSKS